MQRRRRYTGAAPALLACRAMLDMLRDLVAHKGWADAAMLRAGRTNEPAAADHEVLALLHHVLLANRFWLLTVAGLPFVLETEARTSSSFDDLVDRYRVSHAQEVSWFAGATVGDVARVLEAPAIPGGRCRVMDAWTQVCLHSQGHRSQCAKLLRRHGGVPPTTDYIVWIGQRAAARWTEGAVRTFTHAVHEGAS